MRSGAVEKSKFLAVQGFRSQGNGVMMNFAVHPQKTTGLIPEARQIKTEILPELCFS